MITRSSKPPPIQTLESQCLEITNQLEHLLDVPTNNIEDESLFNESRSFEECFKNFRQTSFDLCRRLRTAGRINEADSVRKSRTRLFGLSMDKIKDFNVLLKEQELELLSVCDGTSTVRATPTQSDFENSKYLDTQSLPSSSP